MTRHVPQKGAKSKPAPATQMALAVRNVSTNIESGAWMSASLDSSIWTRIHTGTPPRMVRKPFLRRAAGSAFSQPKHERHRFRRNSAVSGITLGMPKRVATPALPASPRTPLARPTAARGQPRAPAAHTRVTWESSNRSCGAYLLYCTKT